MNAIFKMIMIIQKRNSIRENIEIRKEMKYGSTILNQIKNINLPFI
jgi:hypothetical protein